MPRILYTLIVQGRTILWEHSKKFELISFDDVKTKILNIKDSIEEEGIISSKMNNYSLRLICSKDGITYSCLCENEFLEEHAISYLRDLQKNLEQRSNKKITDSLKINFSNLYEKNSPSQCNQELLKEYLSGDRKFKNDFDFKNIYESYENEKIIKRKSRNLKDEPLIPTISTPKDPKCLKWCKKHKKPILICTLVIILLIVVTLVILFSIL